jgi:hypothetical protein
MCIGDLSKAESANTVADDSSAIDFEWSTSDPSAFELRSAHARSDPLDNKVALELGDGSDDDDHRSTERTTGVDVLAEADELDVVVAEIIEYFEEVADGASDAIEGPDQHYVELASMSIGHQPVQSRSLSFGAADLIGVLTDDLVATLRGHRPQIERLGLGMLI